MSAALKSVTEVRERPILFKAEMVRAILAGRKTQTRRVIKPVQPRADGRWPAGRDPVPDCHFGVPGDRLWVRETWRVGAWKDDGRMAVDYRASPDLVRTPWNSPPKDQFKKLSSESWDDCHGSDADYQLNDDRYVWEHGNSPCRWRPSIFMPRWACRLVLEIAEVRVQRVQEISEEDAKAEGISPLPLQAEGDGCHWTADVTAGPELHGRSAYQAFAKLWESINGEGSWDSNPFVWALTFRRVSP